MVYNIGINNMPKGWRVENEWNKKVYTKWNSMLKRCYSEKYHQRHQTYVGCTVCKRWLLLSNFIEDFTKIEGYDEEKFLNGELVLDKDIKSNGKNKEYSLENCIFVSNSENIRQSNKTMDYSFMQGKNHADFKGENHPKARKVAQYSKSGELIKIWDYMKQAGEQLGINNASICECCQFWEMNCNKEEWNKIYKNRPHKTSGGFIWKYYIEE